MKYSLKPSKQTFGAANDRINRTTAIARRLLAGALSISGLVGAQAMPPNPTFDAAVPFTTGGTSVVRVIGSQKVPVLDGAGADTGADKQIAVDFDADGNPDLLQADATIKLVKIRRGQGDGTFVSFAFTTTDAPTDVAVADVNDDTLPDIIVAAGGKILVYLNTFDSNLATNPNRDLTFATPVTLTAEDASMNPLTLRSVAVADLDGDGLPDIIAGASTGDGNAIPFKAQIAVFSNTTGNAGTFAAADVSVGNGGADFIAVANLDAEDKPDVVVAKAAPAGSYCAFTVFLNDGTGTLSTDGGTAPPVKTDVYDAQSIIALTVGDIDADGNRDVFLYQVSNLNDGSGKPFTSLHAFQNDGTGTSFHNLGGLLLSAQNGVIPGDVTLADLNGDGQPEIVIADSIQGGVTVLLVNASLTHSNQILTADQPLFFDTAAGCRRVGVGDFNKDGKLDLFTANDDTDNADLLLNSTGGGGGGGSPKLTITIAASSDSDPDHGATVRPGDTLTYTLTVSNAAGATTAAKLEVVDRVPIYNPGSGPIGQVKLKSSDIKKGRLVSAFDEHGQTIQEIHWKIGNLAGGAEKKATFAFVVPASFTSGATVTNNTYLVQSLGRPPLPATPVAGTASVSNVAPAYSLTGSLDTPPSVTPGGLVTYTLTFKNLSAQTMSHVTILDKIPSGTFFLHAETDSGVVRTSTVGNDYQNTPTGVLWAPKSIDAGETVTLHVTVQVQLDLPDQTPVQIAAGDVSGAFIIARGIGRFQNFDFGTGPSLVTVTGAPFTTPPALALGKAVINDPQFRTDDVSFSSDANGNQVISAPAPALAQRRGDSEITFLLYFGNADNSSIAVGCYLKDRIPEGTTFVPGSATIGIVGERKAHNKAFLIDNDRTLVMPLPNLASGDGYGYVTYRVKLNSTLTENDTIHWVGANIGAANSVHTPEGHPTDIAITVRGKPAFQCESHQDVTGVLRADASLPAPGYHRYRIFYRNVGTGTAHNVIIKDSTPPGTTYYRSVLLGIDKLDQPGAERGAARDEAIVAPQVGTTGDVYFVLGTLKPGEAGWVQLEVTETAAALNDPTHDLVNNPRIGADEQPIQALRTRGASQFITHAADYCATRKIDPNIAQAFLCTFPPHATPQNQNIRYTFIAGNLSNVDTGGQNQLTIPIPSHTTFVGVAPLSGFEAVYQTYDAAGQPDPPNDQVVKVVFSSYHIPAHSAVGVLLVLKPEFNFQGSITFDRGPVTLDFENGSREAISPSSYVYAHDGVSNVDDAFAASRQQIGLATLANLGADTTQVLQDLVFTGRMNQITRTSTYGIVRGADYFVADNGAVVIPTHADRVVVVGPDSVISNDGGSIISHDGGTVVAQGAGNAIRLDVPGFGNLTAANTLIQAVNVVSQGGGNLINAGALNLIGHGGSTLISNIPASLITEDGASLITEDGASLIGHGGNTIQSITAGLANVKFNAEDLGAEAPGLVTDQGAALAIGAAKGGVMLNAGGGFADKNAGQGTGAAAGVIISSSTQSSAFTLTQGGNIVSEGGAGAISNNGSSIVREGTGN